MVTEIQKNSDAIKYTLPQILVNNAARYGDTKIAIREKAYGIWQKYGWGEYLRYVRNSAAGFAVLNLQRGENVCLIVENNPEWLFCEIAAHALGAVSYTHLTLPTKRIV